MLSAETRAQLAAALAEAERSRVPMGPLTAAYPDIDVVDAYEIQLINIRHRVTEGALVVGHKVGLSSEAMQSMMGVDEPDYGHLLAGTIKASFLLFFFSFLCCLFFLLSFLVFEPKPN